MRERRAARGVPGRARPAPLAAALALAALIGAGCEGLGASGESAGGPGAGGGAGAGAGAEAGALGRDDLLALIGNLGARRHPTPEEKTRLRDACAEFARRFPGDPDAPEVRQRLGLLLAAEGDDAGAARELSAVTASAKAGTPFRTLTLYALGQAETRRGRTEAALAALRAVLSEAPGGEAAKGAAQDVRDLERVGGRAAGAILPEDDPALLAPSPGAPPFAVCVLRRGEPAPEGLPEGARRIEVTGWEDPHVRRFRPPALPRVYVVDGRGVVRAAGVRGAAIAEALRRAQEGP